MDPWGKRKQKSKLVNKTLPLGSGAAIAEPEG
jgi:hypothetical protein